MLGAIIVISRCIQVLQNSVEWQFLIVLYDLFLVIVFVVLDHHFTFAQQNDDPGIAFVIAIARTQPIGALGIAVVAEIRETVQHQLRSFDAFVESSSHHLRAGQTCKVAKKGRETRIHRISYVKHRFGCIRPLTMESKKSFHFTSSIISFLIFTLFYTFFVSVSIKIYYTFSNDKSSTLNSSLWLCVGYLMSILSMDPPTVIIRALHFFCRTCEQFQ